MQAPSVSTLSRTPTAIFRLFAVAHYREDLPVGSVDVAINGHTHVTKEAHVGRCLVLNPGSASYPRGTRGPTMARMLVKDGKIISTKFIDLD